MAWPFKQPLYATARILQNYKSFAQSLSIEKRQPFSKSAVYQNGTGFHKPYMLSKPLADLTGVDQLSRPQVVKAIWDYVKSRGLQDPTDKRYIKCDDTLQKIFKTDRVHMFTMNKLLSDHLHRKDGV
ncbi:SWIB/MDM2 domain-containing protein [Xylaria digitata]|nr:SWIB/MDM2 domain-containing protein [Xylaria digitata]